MAYTYTRLMKEVLIENGKPMTIKQMWDYACEKGFDRKLDSIGKTPKKTMYSCLYRDLDSKTGVFVRVCEKPALFSLKK